MDARYCGFKSNRLKGTTLVKKIFSSQKQRNDHHPKVHFFGFPDDSADVFPDKFTQPTLDALTTRLRHFKGDEFIAYIGTSDAIAHVEGEAAQKEFLKEISSLIDSARDDMGLLLDVALFFDHANIFFVNQRAVAHGAFIASHSIGFLMTDFRPVKDANRPVEVAILLEKP